MPYHARTHFARLLIFTLVFTLGSLLIVPGCKSTKSTESKEETPKIQPQVTTKKNLPPRKKKRLKPQKKGNSVLYVRLRFADLFSIPQIQGKTEELKVAALKQGYLGAMLRCHLDFTSQLEMMALMVPQDFKKSRRGSLTFKGTFEAEKMARCIFADMGWKVSGKTGALLNVTGDDLSLEVDVKS
ncbi:hypothetical protein KJ865_13185, partial [Myxococcota bacterium]|nr:hypothetical protein [Myxococcota bacterium]